MRVVSRIACSVLFFALLSQAHATQNSPALLNNDANPVSTVDGSFGKRKSCTTEMLLNTGWTRCSRWGEKESWQRFPFQSPVKLVNRIVTTALQQNSATRCSTTDSQRQTKRLRKANLTRSLKSKSLLLQLWLQLKLRFPAKTQNPS